MRRDVLTAATGAVAAAAAVGSEAAAAKIEKKIMLRRGKIVHATPSQIRKRSYTCFGPFRIISNLDTEQAKAHAHEFEATPVCAI